MLRIEHRDYDAVFFVSKAGNSWVVTVTGYDFSSSSVTERIRCQDLIDVKEVMDNFYAIPILQRN